MLADLKVIKSNDPAVRSWAEALLCYPGLHALFAHRLAHMLWQLRFFLIARMVSHVVRFLTGVEIHPGATVGKGVFIDHGIGVVIGETAVIGDNVMLFHGVTLGGTGKQNGKRHPTIKDGVTIGAQATILGPVTIETGAKVGAGAVVLQDIPAYATVIGVPPAQQILHKKENAPH